MRSKIWLSKPHLSNFEIEYIQEALQTNWVTTLGQNVDQFECDLEQYLANEKHVAVVNSGTSAIHLALILAGVKRGDEVICQSFTFSATANPIVYLGANPVFIDSEAETWNLCPVTLEKVIKNKIAIGKKPKAIIAVHLYGMPAKIAAIATIAKKYEIVLIEDAAEALGASYKGQKCGTFGDFGILSFNGNKIITTSGGGALVCNSKAIKEKAVFLATQAKDEEIYYQHSEVGYNYRMSNVLAGIGRGQMKVLDSYVGLRRAMHQFYQEVFKGVKGVTVFQEPNANFYSNYWLTCIVVDAPIAGFTKEEIRLQLLEDNIESRLLWKPLHLQPIFEKYECYLTTISENLFKNGLCLPSGSNITDEERERIQKSINKVVNKSSS